MENPETCVLGDFWDLWTICYFSRTHVRGCSADISYMGGAHVGVMREKGGFDAMIKVCEAFDKVAADT